MSVYDRSAPERVTRRVHAAATRARRPESVGSRVCLRHACLLTKRAQCDKGPLSDSGLRPEQRAMQAVLHA